MPQESGALHVLRVKPQNVSAIEIRPEIAFVRRGTAIAQPITVTRTLSRYRCF